MQSNWKSLKLSSLAQMVTYLPSPVSINQCFPVLCLQNVAPRQQYAEVVQLVLETVVQVRLTAHIYIE